MLQKIYEELVAIRKALQGVSATPEDSESASFVMVREPYSRTYKWVRTPAVHSGQGEEDVKRPEMPEPVWRRFELLAESDAEKERLERVLNEHHLSRQDLAVILFGLRVRPEFGKEHFGM